MTAKTTLLIRNKVSLAETKPSELGSAAKAWYELAKGDVLLVQHRLAYKRENKREGGLPCCDLVCTISLIGVQY